MNNLYKRLSSQMVIYTIISLALIWGNTNAQIVTNGSFENTNIGVVTGTGVKGWVIQAINDTIAKFQITDSTVQKGEKSLKVAVNGTGANPWDIQIVADSLPVSKGKTYIYSIWAKAKKAGAKVNFTVGRYSYAEYGAIRDVNITTEWKNITLQFTVDDDQAYIRAPIHLSNSANTGNEIYLDNLEIKDINYGKTPVIVEAESGLNGTNISINQDGDITYVSPIETYAGQSTPGDSSRTITYQVEFQDSGYYNLFARIRVGSGAWNDDSFFAGRGFGDKSDTTAGDWVMVNGLAGAGFSNPTDVVNELGVAGTEIWKWVNISKNLFPLDSTSKPFFVSLDSLTKTFKIGSREDGLQFDKLAFGKAYLYYTVNHLDNGLPGSKNIEGNDSSKFWPGPPLAEKASKFLGAVPGTNDKVFARYWNQLTPGNEGKWASVAGSTSDTTKWNWSGLDKLYNYAKDNNLIFKNHTLIWGAQQPAWINDLDSATQYKYIETWIRMVGKRYPAIDMIDVVNEPLFGHNPPDGQNGRANYKKALGGNGVTGWDWVINAFTLARKYLPNTKLLLNDYGIINDNASTSNYLKIINLLKERNLIDGIGVQGHRFEFESTTVNTLKYNLDRLALTELPVYISEMDLGNIGDSGTPNDETQLNLYKKIFPTVWGHPAVQGITLWGYLEGQMWQPTCYLVHADGTPRPAFDWLVQFIKDNPTDVEETVTTLPKEYRLEQNYPNPFNPVTNIRYSIVNTTDVTLKIFDVLGREISTLVNSVQTPGQYTVTFDAHNLESGVYFYRLNAGNFVETKKLMLLK